MPPDHWSLRDNTTGKLMFVTSGHPTVYLQGPDGRVLHRQDDYVKGDVSSIRKAIDDYEGRRDTDLRHPLRGLKLPPLVLGGLGALGLILLLSRKGKNVQ